MGTALQVLIVEDSEDDARLMVRELARGGYDPTWLRVETQEAMIAALDRQTWDVIVADYSLPRFSAPAALQVVRQRRLDIPFIVVTGKVGEDVAVEMMKAGAHDYFLKDRLTRLPAAVKQELRDAEERQAHKRAEEQVRLVTHALESAANGIVITDAEGTILWVNPAFSGMTGYGRDEAIGQNPRLLKSGRQDRPFYERLWHTIKTEGKDWHGEVVNKRKDGSLYTEDMTITPVRDGQGVITHFVAIKQDITARQQTEAALHESEEQFRHTIEYLPVGIGVTDLHDNILILNKKFVELFGYTQRDLPTLTEWWTRAYPAPLYRDRVRREWYAALKQAEQEHKEITPQEWTVTCKDGSRRDISFRASCIGERWLVTFVDLTEHKQMEHHAQRIERLAALGQLLGGIAHELKNPLFILTGRLQLLNEKLEDREYDHVKPDLQKIGEAAHRMTEIAQRFLTLARPRPPSLQVCLIPTVLNGVLTFLSNECMKQNIVVVTHFADDLSSCLADPSQLHQVFLNLILNAIQAMATAHERGTLTVHAMAITLRREAARGGPTPSGPTEPWVEVRIQDDGPGIAPEHQSKIFEPFFSTKPPEQGTGLGLWTVRTIVLEMNGTVTFETEVGKGTTFIVRLPLLSVPFDSATMSHQPVKPSFS